MHCHMLSYVVIKCHELSYDVLLVMLVSRLANGLFNTFVMNCHDLLSFIRFSRDALSRVAIAQERCSRVTVLLTAQMEVSELCMQVCVLLSCLLTVLTHLFVFSRVLFAYMMCC